MSTNAAAIVTLAPEELRSIAPQTSSDLEITAFVRLPEIDPVYFEASLCEA